MDDAQEEYNLHLKKLKEEQNINKAKFDSDLKVAYEKHQKFCDQLELEKSGKLENLIKERKEAERKVILKRKKKRMKYWKNLKNIYMKNLIKKKMIIDIIN